MRIIFLMTKCHDFSKGMRIFILLLNLLALALLLLNEEEI